MTVSYLIPTAGRVSLRQTLASIETAAGDEILVIGSPCPFVDPRVRVIPCAAGHDQGATELQAGMPHARGQWLSFIGDDDTYVPGARAKIAGAMHLAPGRPSLFQIEYPSGRRLWVDATLRCGNVSGQMIVLPNDPAKLGTWGGPAETNDWHFLTTMGWHPRAIAWQPATLVRMGHD